MIMGRRINAYPSLYIVVESRATLFDEIDRIETELNKATILLLESQTWIQVECVDK